MLNERRRLQRLTQLKVLDTASDLNFDVVVARALASFPGASIAAVSLVDAERQWFKAIVGLGVKQTPRAVSFCAHTIRSDDPMVVEDATKDARFADNLLVTSTPHIRFYAGVPLVDGVGALCVISSAPRKATAAELSGLQGLATYINIHLMLNATIANLKLVKADKAW